MPESPEQPIEQALRAYASKRRHAADADSAASLHPATRRLLQSEVARVHGRQSHSAASPASPPAWWPRLAWAFGVCLVLGAILAAILGPPASRSPDQLAKHSPPPETPPDEPAAPAATPNPASTPAPVPALKLSESAQQKSFSNGEVRQTSPVIQREAAPRFRETVAADPYNSRPIQPATDFAQTQLTPAAPSGDTLRFRTSTPPSQSPGWVGAYTREIQPAASSNFFAPAPEFRRLRIADGTPPAAAAVQPVAAKEILRAFQVDNVNGKLRFVDADGSAYMGHFVPTSAAISRFTSPTGALGTATVPAQSATPAAARLETAESTGQPARFVVAGTNVTLGKLVIYSGTLKSDSTTNATAAAPPPDDRTSRGLNEKSRASGTFVFEGKVNVGGTDLGVLRAVQSPAPAP